MNASIFRHLLLGMAVWLAAILSASACQASTKGSFQRSDEERAATTVQAFFQADMVVYGTIENPKPDYGNVKASSDLVIETVFKDHAFLRNRKVLQLPRYIPVLEDTKWLVFCRITKEGHLDPWIGRTVRVDSDLVRYLKGAISIQNKPVVHQLKYSFNYLDNTDVDIRAYAHNVFQNAKYKDIRRLAAELPPDKIAKLMQDPFTPRLGFRLYPLLLGHCGQEKHADMLLAMLRDPKKYSNTSLMHGVLTGYILLRPKLGWIEIESMLGNSKEDFCFRYAALLTVRFLLENRPDVVAQDKLMEGLMILLDQGDIADLAIEDLRRYQRWEVCEKVLGLHSRASHDIPIIRRAILRYALSCPKPSAVALVTEHRKREPEVVKDMEELLRLETSAALLPLLFFF